MLDKLPYRADYYPVLGQIMSEIDVAGTINRIVDSMVRIGVLNKHFNVGGEYIGECVWAKIETAKQSCVILYNDENLQVRKIKKFNYEICEKICYLDHSIFRSDLK